MKLKITHNTEYIFDSEVFLEPHTLRFRPKNTPYSSLDNYLLTIVSKPEGHRIIRDEENNLIDFCWFTGLTKTLHIKSESILDIESYNPFDFILHPPTYNHIPFTYEAQQKELLIASLKQLQLTSGLIEYGYALQKNSNFNTIPYLTNLTDTLHNDFEVVYREEGSPLSPDETFQLKKGSCRDLSWMQINLLRHQGFAARFVSGYFYFDMDEPAYELHAWVEVFLPGTGWLGLDPSHGILTGNMHFPISSSAQYQNTMPVSGGIRGSAKSKLITDLIIERI